MTAVGGVQDALRALEVAGPDVIVSDLAMPGQDGYALIGHLREAERQHGRPAIPVIALTAMAQQSDRDRCMQAGMDEYLSKPLRAAELYATLDRVLARQGEELNPEFKRRYEPAVSPQSISNGPT